MPPSKGKTSSATTRNKRSHRHTTVSRSKVKRKGKKKTVAELIPNKFYKIREILEKNSKSGKYLIDWEDDPVTKEKFPQTWVCISLLTRRLSLAAVKDTTQLT